MSMGPTYPRRILLFCRFIEALGKDGSRESSFNSATDRHENFKAVYELNMRTRQIYSLIKTTQETEFVDVSLYIVFLMNLEAVARLWQKHSKSCYMVIYQLKILNRIIHGLASDEEDLKGI